MFVIVPPMSTPPVDLILTPPLPTNTFHLLLMFCVKSPPGKSSTCTYSIRADSFLVTAIPLANTLTSWLCILPTSSIRVEGKSLYINPIFSILCLVMLTISLPPNPNCFSNSISSLTFNLKLSMIKTSLS